jgi:FkbM family methyltransferase
MTEMPLTTYVYKTLASERDPIFVIDVGCSYTGVGSEWNAFGPALRGVGFDPLEPEIARLQAIEARPNISYEAAFVGLKASQSVERPESKCQVLQELRYERSSAFRAAQLAAFDHVKEVFNAGANPKYSERHLAIDDWIAETKTPPQILKIDTEGADMQVLLGARQAIENSVLAIHMECMFQGSLGPYANTLACIDLFLREKGFCLFTMDPFRYTRSALPGPFIYDMFAQTKNGQLIWADALYLRDLAEEDYEATFGFSATSERVLATACIMELFGLQDCAAELIQRFADRLPYGAESLLDLLVPPYLGPGLSYRDYIARFERNPRLLFASAQSATPRRADTDARARTPRFGATYGGPLMVVDDRAGRRWNLRAHGGQGLGLCSRAASTRSGRAWNVGTRSRGYRWANRPRSHGARSARPVGPGVACEER